MSAPKSPRKGSLQFWPRKRARKFLPRVNWNAINSGKNLKGFIAYKAGMKSAIVKDNTEHSMTKGKRIAVPVTILECPNIKIFSVRFYKNGIVKEEVIAEESLKDKELKRKIKLPKIIKKKLDKINLNEVDNVSVIVYSQIKKTNLKKTPDFSEIGIAGNNVNEKINFVKGNINKEISVLDVFEKGDLVDVRGLTTGRGLQGPVKRFGITLKRNKAEKGRRNPGSLGPWHPARVTFRAPQAGQVGMFTRVIYNNKILDMGKAENKKELKGIKNYGDVKTDYIILRGSIQGPSKRQLVITNTLRPTREQTKKKFDLLELN